MKVGEGFGLVHVKGDTRSLVVAILSHSPLLRLLPVLTVMTATWRLSAYEGVSKRRLIAWENTL